MASTDPNLFSSIVSYFASFVKNVTKELPVTKFESISLKNDIGKGGFGEVILCEKNGESLVLKKMLHEDEIHKRLCLKEAGILNMLKHENIVRFHSLCQHKEEPITSFLLEYVQFVFPFGHDKSVSSLQDFLSYINTFDCDRFEHLQNFLARDICAGLAYLHESDVVHRDLKPGNVLVSNQHYSSLSGQEFERMWRTQPVIAKLTDFGESRAALVQTNNVLHTHTMNIFRGTILYMAPEILKHDGISEIRLEELKNMDIWSYAMVLFMLLNPDLRYPYERELKELIEFPHIEAVEMKLRRLFEIHILPSDSRKYDPQRKSHWGIIFEVYRFCAKFTSRPTAREALSLIESLLDRKSNTMTLEGDIPRIEQIYATLYGQCIGESMSKEAALMYYCRKRGLKYRDQIMERHGKRWEVGEFILIVQSLIDNNGVVNLQDFARRLIKWNYEGYPEDGGIGIDDTTCNTVTWTWFYNCIANPHKISQDVCKESSCSETRNGGVVRTSILGILAFWHIDQVYRNAIDICKTTHSDPRCQASAVSVCIAISLMLKRQYPHFKNGEYNIPKIIDDVFSEASTCLQKQDEEKELWRCLNCADLSALQLDVSVSYTYKCLGAGFWALKQNDFEKALTEIARNGGDSDANCAVAGALLGCKLGSRKCFPESCLNLRNRHWLDMLIQRFLEVLNTL